MTEQQRKAMNAHFARLMALPADNPERQSLRDRVPLTGAALEKRARKFCGDGNSSEWCRNPGRHLQTPRKPVYPAWTYYRTLPAHLKMPTDWCVVKGKTRAWTLQTYVRAFEKLNGLRSTEQGE